MSTTIWINGGEQVSEAPIYATIVRPPFEAPRKPILREPSRRQDIYEPIALRKENEQRKQEISDYSTIRGKSEYATLVRFNVKEDISPTSDYGSYGTTYETFKRQEEAPEPKKEGSKLKRLGSKVSFRVPFRAASLVARANSMAVRSNRVPSPEPVVKFREPRPTTETVENSGIARRQSRYQRRSAKEFFQQNLQNARRLVRRNSVNCDVLTEAEKMRAVNGLFSTHVPYADHKSNDFLTLLEKMQSQRLDDQRCEMPEIHKGFSIVRDL